MVRRVADLKTLCILWRSPLCGAAMRGQL